jgi:hypothetical protein
LPAVTDDSLLVEVELFSGLGPDDLAAVIEAAEDRAFQRGDVIFTEGDESTELFVVTSGRVAIANKSVDGRESMVALMERGDLFGEMPLFDGLTCSAEARALEASDVMAIPYALLKGRTSRSLTCSGASSRCSRLPPERPMSPRRLGVPRRHGTHRASAPELSNDADESSCPSRRRSWPAWSAHPASVEQGHRLVREARLDRAGRPPLPHHQSRTAHPPLPLTPATPDDHACAATPHFSIM